MAFLTQKKFDFVSRGLAPDTFGVVRFKGSEGFSGCYRFEIDLVSTEAEIDLDQALKNPATFTILREDGDIPFHGILTQKSPCLRIIISGPHEVETARFPHDTVFAHIGEGVVMDGFAAGRFTEG